ncbi:unnamed protein product [Ceratitis capitata]|uniref:(Mediterranean fruit fly) hypothetical protein n=1 Tax=Ceratitis capitata TaxID=7213 RepID=A0A811TZA7_CERCA|nr:unnamed protein product [Ceratitis capitata]
MLDCHSTLVVITSPCLSASCLLYTICMAQAPLCACTTTTTITTSIVVCLPREKVGCWLVARVLSTAHAKITANNNNNMCDSKTFFGTSSASHSHRRSRLPTTVSPLLSHHNCSLCQATSLSYYCNRKCNCNNVGYLVTTLPFGICKFARVRSVAVVVAPCTYGMQITCATSYRTTIITFIITSQTLRQEVRGSVDVYVPLMS